MVLALVAVIGGVALLAFAADQFVVGAARVALLRRIPTLVVGVVIIGFGTSAPELIVSALAAVGDSPEIAVGNIVGSNLVNLSLLLGIGAILTPLAVTSRTVRREAPITALAMVAFAVVVQGGMSILEGVFLLVLAAAAFLAVTKRRRGDDPLGPEAIELAQPRNHRLSHEVGRTILGLAGTIGAAQLLLWGAVDLAERAGLSEGFVGATMVAIGTSLPELVTVIQSARRRQPDLIVGNLLGSNMFNALAVGGVVGLLGPSRLDAPALTGFAAVAGVVVALLAWLAMRTGYSVRRREGVALVIAYLVAVPILA